MAQPTGMNTGHVGAQQDISITGVIGTLGTADVGGTALTLPFGVDPTTGAMYVNILAGAGAASNPTSGTLSTLGTVGTILGIGGTVQVSGASAGTNVNIVTGSQQTLGTVGTVNGVGGTTNVTLATRLDGTNDSITVTVGTIGGKAASGAASVANPVQIAGTDAGGTIYSPLVTSAGALTVTGASAGTNVNIVTGSLVGTVSLNSSGTILNLAAGTVTSVGSVVGVGTISNTVTTSGIVTAGTVGGKAASGAASVANPVLIAGTDAGGTVYAPLISTTGIQTTNLTSSGTILNLATGTIASLPAVSLTSSGTILNLATGTIASLPAVSLTSSGTILNLATGTIASLPAVSLTSSGTILNLASGTLASITNLANGTVHVDPTPAVIGTYYGTVGTTGAAVWGTLVPSVGNGLKVYVTGLDVVVTSGTVDTAITNGVTGSTGTFVLNRGQYIAGGGISKNFIPTMQTGTGGTIAFWMGGAGTVAYNLQYFVAA